MTKTTNYSFVFFFFSGTIAKYIHVTQNSIGRDQAECGSRTAPCKTVEYAVSILKSFEVILIGGGHEQQYKYELTDTLLIDKELTLRSSNANRRVKSCHQKDCNIDIKGSNFSSSVL